MTDLIPKFGPGTPELFQQISQLIEARDKKSLKHILADLHSADIAEVIENLSIEYAIFLFRQCNREDQSEIIVELDSDLQGQFVAELEVREISPIVENLESDQATNLFAELSDEKVEEILGNLNKKDSELIRNQLNFREYSAGRLMNNEFVIVRDTENVRKGIINVRKKAQEIDTIYLVYVMDENGRLKGNITLNELFLAQTNVKISKIVKPAKYTFHYNDDQELVAKQFRKYDLVSAPVVDDDMRMIGRITVDDILDIIEEEASEDFMRIGGVSEEEKLSTSIWLSVKRRMAWLHLNLVTSFLSASVVSYFAPTIERLVILAALMPIVAGLGGNAGTQSITVTVRNIATGDIKKGNWAAGLKKELSMGFINGLILGSGTALILYFFQGNSSLSMVLGMAMFINLLLAGFVGSVIPLILKLMGIDPAIASSIFVTAVTDIGGFFTFLGLATMFIQYLG